MQTRRGHRDTPLALLLCVTFTLVITCSGSRLQERSLQRSNLEDFRSFLRDDTEISREPVAAWSWFKSHLTRRSSRSLSRSPRSEVNSHGVRVKRQAEGTSFGLTSRECGFVPVDNASFVEWVYPYFSAESSTNILEYDVTVISNGDAFNLFNASGPETYKPFRWYRTQGEGSSELLQVNHYYFGFIWPFMDLGLDKVKVTLNVTSPACLVDLPRGEIELLLTDYFLKDFDINPKAVEHPFVKAGTIEVCHMTIRNDNDWGKLTYKCCGFESDILHCRDVTEDAWVWVLRAFIMAVTILLFLYFPVILPRGYRIYDYAYYPPDGLQFNFLVTKRAENYRDMKDTQVLRPKNVKAMTKLRSSLVNLRQDVIYTAHVRKLNVNVCADRLLQEDWSVINIRRSLFDTFVRCKIRHADPLEDCCKTNACGTYCLPGRPSWQAWLRAVRTVLVMAALAVPALPFMYAQFGEGLEYQELDDAIEDRGLQRPFNFYVGKIFSKIVVGVLASMYVFHTVIVMIDGATDGNIGRLYSDVLDVSEKKGTIRKHMEKSQSCVKRALRPVQRCGVLMVPVWVLALMALPLYLILDFFFRAPMIRVFVEGFRRLVNYMKAARRKPEDDAKTVCGMIEIYLFFLSIVFVFIVLGIGANFVVHVAAMLIVKVLVDAKLVYRVLPVVLLLILYIRDSFSRVAQKYSDFLAQVMTALRAREADDLRRESFKRWDQQMNKIFKILPEQIEADPDDEAVQVKAKDTKNTEKTTKDKKLFMLKNGGVRMRLGQLLLFLNKDDFLFTSKKFLFNCCTMDCTGAPGHLEDNYIRAAIDFMKIAIFLIFLFLVVMAYGNAYYISPNNQMFVTLVSGLVPLILRNVLLKRGAVDTVKVDYRFESRLQEKIAAFIQSWQIQDICLKDLHVWGAPSSEQKSSPPTETGGQPSDPSVSPMESPKETTGKEKGNPVVGSNSGKAGSVLHLVLDVSEDPSFLDHPPASQPTGEVDPYALGDCSSKKKGCCNWRSRVKRFIYCSCFKGDNSVAAGQNDNVKVDDKAKDKEKNDGPAWRTSRRRSSMNFFWDGESQHPVSSDTNGVPHGNHNHPHDGNSSKPISTHDPRGTPLGEFNPRAASFHRESEEVPESEEQGRPKLGRWIRQSEERREAMRRARDANERARAAHIISGIDAYLISNALASTMGVAGEDTSGNRGQMSGGDASFVDSPNGGGDATEA